MPRRLLGTLPGIGCGRDPQPHRPGGRCRGPRRNPDGCDSPDAEHPYGHHKATSLVALLIGAGILLFCALVLIDSTRVLLAGTTVVPHWPTLAMALLSLLAKELLFHRTRRIAMESLSTMVLVNAWHHRTDSLTSVIAAVGIAVVLLLGPRWSFLDAVIGIAMAGYFATSGAQLEWRAVNDLMDSAPKETVINDLREHLLEVPGAIGYHEFRARRVGDMIEVDLHLLVPPELSVEEAHQVARRVKHAIQQAHPEVLNVLFHLDASHASPFPEAPPYRHPSEAHRPTTDPQPQENTKWPASHTQKRKSRIR